MEYTHTCSKMALADVVDESIANEKIMEEINTPMISEDMYLLSDALFTKFEFDETFQFQDWCLPDVAEPVAQGPPGPPGILRHDCMWNGTCIDKDHDYNFRNRCIERNQISNKANNNRSLLRSNSKIEKRKNTTTSINKKTIKKMLNNKQDDYNCQTSDGELPDTPPDSDSDNEIPSFKHEININEKLSECMNEFEELFSVSEVTGQSIVYETDNNNNNNNRYFGGRKMMNISKQEMNNDNQTSDEDDDDEEEDEEEEEDSDDHEEEEKEVEEQVKNIKTSTNENINSAIIQNNKEMQQNTLNDHCYYTQNVNTKKFDNLGVCTPSDSEEEIDVVTFEKPSKPSLPTFPSIAEQKSFQMTVNNALIKPAPRPRGRPPLNSNNNNNNNINNNINIINNNIININTINNINNINTINNNNTNIISNNIINNNNNIINNYNNNNNNANSRKRVVQEQKQNKRGKQSNPYQRKPKVEKNIPINKLPIIEPIIYKQEPIFKQEPMNDYEGNDFHSDDEPETDKRNLHNNMERQRRIELKDSFEFLRRLVPDLIEIDKAPKVKILNTAANYCEKLTVRYNELDYQKRELVKTQLRLKETVSKLRRCMSERFLSRAQ